MTWQGLIVLIPLLAGCATQPLNTTSRRPEVTIHNASAAKVRNVVINHLIDAGWKAAAKIQLSTEELKKIEAAA